MFYKVLRVVIISILVSIIAGFALSPVTSLDIFQKNNLASIMVSLIIFLLEAALTLAIAQRFLTLKKGEAKELALILTVLSLALGVYKIIVGRAAINTLNYIDHNLSGSNTSLIPQPTSLSLAIASELIQAVIIYYLGVWILRKSERE